MKQVLLILLLTVIISSSVSAITLSSAPFESKTILFEPNLEFIKKFTIKDIKYEAAPYITGDLREYVTIDIVENITGRITWIATMKLPETLEPAGKHTVIFGAKDIAPANSGGILALTRAQKEMFVQVLYDEKVAEFYGLGAQNINEGEVSEVTFVARSLSKQDITGINGEINVLDFDKKKIASIPFETFDLLSAQEKVITTDFNSTDLDPGQYFMEAHINWADQKTYLDYRSFNIGTLKVAILDFTRNFTASVINKLTIDVESKWKGFIGRVYADIYLDDVKMSTTQNYGLTSFERKDLTGFLDLSTIEGKTHTLRIDLHYDTESTSVEEEITIPGNKQGFPLTSIEIMMILVIVVLMIVILLFIKNNRKDKKKDKR